MSEGGWEEQSKIEGIESELDENWWASILSEGEDYPEINQNVPKRESFFQGLLPVDWELVRRLYENDEVVCLQVFGFNRGGLLVHGTGIQGFVPISHIIDFPPNASEDVKRKCLTGYVGKLLNLKVIECEPSMERVVLSMRAACAGEGTRKQLLRILSVGEVLQGVVTNITDFGVFVDLGGVEGLIHVSELSWGRVQHASEIVTIGQTIRTQVLQVCEESARVALSLKRLIPNPWETLQHKVKPGDIIRATITTIIRYGAFARLPEGVEGLIHSSSIHLPPGTNEISQFISPGQNVEVEVLHLDIERRRLGLGLVRSE